MIHPCTFVPNVRVVMNVCHSLLITEICRCLFRKQLEECFHLMDQDGSGSIDVDELGAAFKLLGRRLARVYQSYVVACISLS
jgi:hypothetical protein